VGAGIIPAYRSGFILDTTEYFFRHKDSDILLQKKSGGWNKRVEKLCEKRFTFSSHELLSCLNLNSPLLPARDEFK
jgi:hypothetical protein